MMKIASTRRSGYFNQLCTSRRHKFCTVKYCNNWATSVFPPTLAGLTYNTSYNENRNEMNLAKYLKQLNSYKNIRLLLFIYKENPSFSLSIVYKFSLVCFTLLCDSNPRELIIQVISMYFIIAKNCRKYKIFFVPRRKFSSSYGTLYVDVLLFGELKLNIPPYAFARRCSRIRKPYNYLYFIFSIGCPAPRCLCLFNSQSSYFFYRLKAKNIPSRKQKSMKEIIQQNARKR